MSQITERSLLAGLSSERQRKILTLASHMAA